MKQINEIAKKINVEIEEYGNYMAKITKVNNAKKGKLILVTSTNPTPYGEGKTTLSIGLCDSLNKLNEDSIVVLREPSLGPVFGKKGGAIGGGKSKVEPEEKINLHFTGDMHAITSANNLISAVIDNHIYQGNEFKIDTVTFKRCIDMNDRSLRDNFVITAASEIMAVLCLSTDYDDLKERISNIVIGYSNNKEIYVKDLKCENAVCLLLKDAIKPNLVQTTYNNPAIIHGGPFANIAQGTSSIISIKAALSSSDYVVTEAGFGSDMGAIKFIDIVSKNNNIYPDVIVINTTVKALKYNGNNSLENGIENLKFHINNMKKYSDNVVVSLNKYEDDTSDDIDFIKDFCEKENTDFVISTNYVDGEDGCITLANKIINYNDNNKKYFVYDKDDSLEIKIEKMLKELGCNNIIYSDISKEKIQKYNNTKLDICISKTPMSITDDKKILGYPKDFSVKVTDININNGAKFISVLLGDVLTMPGLAKESNYLKM